VACVLVLAAASAAATAAGARSAVSSTLYAGFDADGNIRLTFADGTMIGTPSAPGTVVPAGTYTIQVNNKGSTTQAASTTSTSRGPA
jgi:archaellum component FlaG (FlaF/FlaG flagellin family)